MNICVYGAASSEIDQFYIDVVEKLCKELGMRGHTLIFGAGGNGLMGAAARGFRAGGGRVCGVVPLFFKEQKIEALDKDSDNVIYTRDMGARKQIMEENADAFIVTPGGIGTFDEFFQVLTLKQLRQNNKPIALFNINGYYYSIQALMHNGAKEKFLREDCLELYKVFDETEVSELIDYIESPPEECDKTVAELKYS
ncbi:MAG: TIGR00730 family Rossman fold protein [Lachnospiraceae bacterium]|nr:TIGR00730 family Rossman fold protein [Lachnospiraceae bacterium]